MFHSHSPNMYRRSVYRALFYSLSKPASNEISSRFHNGAPVDGVDFSNIFFIQLPNSPTNKVAC